MPWGITKGPRAVGGIAEHPTTAVVHRMERNLVDHGGTAQTEYMRYPCMWLLLLSLLLLLFPVSSHRTAFSSPSPEPSWRWPLESPVEVLRPFDPPEQRWLPGHLGVDLAAEPGQEVYAAGPGRVRFAGEVAGVGVVSVVHGDLHTTYLPVEPSVARGELVTDQPLGTLAAEPRHCPDRTCLHWGLLRGTTYLDPLSLLGLGQVRLLPLPGGIRSPAHF